MRNYKSLFLLLFLLLNFSCQTNAKKESIDYGSAIISDDRQEIDAREHHYFSCEKWTEENPFGSFTELDLDENELQFKNTASSAFEGRIIIFKIKKNLNISEVSYEEWFDVIQEDRAENFEVVECGINMNLNPFEMSGQELVATYFVKVKQTTEYKWSWNKEPNFFTITGRFKCNKNMW